MTRRSNRKSSTDKSTMVDNTSSSVLTDSIMKEMMAVEDNIVANDSDDADSINLISRVTSFSSAFLNEENDNDDKKELTTEKIERRDDLDTTEKSTGKKSSNNDKRSKKCNDDLFIVKIRTKDGDKSEEMISVNSREGKTNSIRNNRQERDEPHASHNDDRYYPPPPSSSSYPYPHQQSPYHREPQQNPHYNNYHGYHNPHQNPNYNNSYYNNQYNQPHYRNTAPPPNHYKFDNYRYQHPHQSHHPYSQGQHPKYNHSYLQGTPSSSTSFENNINNSNSDYYYNKTSQTKHHSQQPYVTYNDHSDNNPLSLSNAYTMYRTNSNTTATTSSTLHNGPNNPPHPPSIKEDYNNYYNTNPKLLSSSSSSHSHEQDKLRQQYEQQQKDTKSKKRVFDNDRHRHRNFHRRTCSSTSTASSLSIGGLSVTSSYEEHSSIATKIIYKSASDASKKKDDRLSSSSSSKRHCLDMHTPCKNDPTTTPSTNNDNYVQYILKSNSSITTLEEDGDPKEMKRKKSKDLKVDVNTFDEYHSDKYSNKAEFDFGITPVSSNHKRRDDYHKSIFERDQKEDVQKKRFFSSFHSTPVDSSQPVANVVSHDDTVTAKASNSTNTTTEKVDHDDLVQQDDHKSIEKPKTAPTKNNRTRQSFTPLPMIDTSPYNKNKNDYSQIFATASSDTSSIFNNNNSNNMIAPQLSWCITGDSPIPTTEEDPKHRRSNSILSAASNLSLPSSKKEKHRKSNDTPKESNETAGFMTPVSLWEENDYQKILSKKTCSFSLPGSLPSTPITSFEIATDEEYRFRSPYPNSIQQFRNRNNTSSTMLYHTQHTSSFDMNDDDDPVVQLKRPINSEQYHLNILRSNSSGSLTKKRYPESKRVEHQYHGDRGDDRTQHCDYSDKSQHSGFNASAFQIPSSQQHKNSQSVGRHHCSSPVQPYKSSSHRDSRYKNERAGPDNDYMKNRGKNRPTSPTYNNTHPNIVPSSSYPSRLPSHQYPPPLHPQYAHHSNQQHHYNTSNKMNSSNGTIMSSSTKNSYPVSPQHQPNKHMPPFMIPSRGANNNSSRQGPPQHHYPQHPPAGWPRHTTPYQYPRHSLPPPSHHPYPSSIPPHHQHFNHSLPPPPPMPMPGPMSINGTPIYSKRKCIPLKSPIPSKFQGDMDKMKNASVPEFTSLVNFPIHMSSSSKQQSSVNSFMDGHRNCVMCGQLCACSSNSTKKSKDKNIETSRPHSSTSSVSIIPTQNKGLCTNCDVNVWIVVSSGLQIKWCKGCKNFRPWAAFGEKGLATKCVRCRDRQREKYALQKEEKEKLQLQEAESSDTKDDNTATSSNKREDKEDIIPSSSTGDDITDDLLQISSSLKSMSTDD